MRDAALESVAVGFFDGVHLGHQKLLRRAVRAVTFRNHPLTVLAPERAPRLIMSPEEKVAAIRACGVDEVELVDFTPEVAALRPEDFAAQYLERGGLHPAIVCGENWRFGAGGRGDAELLRSLGFDVTVVSYAVCDGERVSSSRIRQCLEAGEIERASAMLGRPVVVSGTRFRGKGKGAQIGFPTVNIKIGAPPAELLPHGVYSAMSAGARAVANYGVAPTMGEAAWTEPVLELHFIDTPLDCMDAGTTTAELRRFIRPEAKFDSVESLRRQIAADVESAMRE